MSWFGSACGFIGGLVSAACSVVGGLVTGLSPIGWIGVCGAVFSLCKALGLFDKEKDEVELGDKVLQAEEKGIKLDKYESYDEYLKKLEEFEVDPKRSKEIPEAAKRKAGAEVMTGCLMERFGEAAISALLGMAGKIPGFFTPERMTALGKMALSDKNVVKDIKDYLTSRDDNIIASTIKTAIELQKITTPGIDDRSAKMEIKQQRDEYLRKIKNGL